MRFTKPLKVVRMSSWFNEICHFVVMMQNIPQRRYFRLVGKFDKLWNSCMLGKFSNFFPVSSFRNCQKFSNTRSIYTLKTAYVHAIMTPYVSCNRVVCRLLIQHTVSTDMYHYNATPPRTCLQWWYMSTPQHPGHAFLTCHFNLSLIEESDIRLRCMSWWQQARQFDVVGCEQRSVANQWQDRIV